MTTGEDKQVQVNARGVDKNSYEAIVIGSGISGGWVLKNFANLVLKHWYLNGEEMLST
jgi:hypothetical protein